MSIQEEFLKQICSASCSIPADLQREFLLRNTLNLMKLFCSDYSCDRALTDTRCDEKGQDTDQIVYQISQPPYVGPVNTQNRYMTQHKSTEVIKNKY